MHTIPDGCQRLAIDVIRQDGGTQPRSIVHDDWIADYAADMQAGAIFPPVVVFFDGASYWLADGFHRVGAAVASGQTDIDADVRQGTRRDAVLFSVGANGQHGHRRTNDDKRRAVDVLLNDPEWARWSDGEIARRCGVSQPFVSQRRAGHTLSHNHYEIAVPRLVTRGGTTYEMQTSGIGHRDEPGSALITCAEAAAMMDVPVHYVEAAGIVQEHGDLELIKKVERGEVDVLDAVAICLNFTEISQDTIKAMVEAHKWLDKKVTAGSLVQMVEMFGREDPEEPISEARDLKIVEAARRILVEKAKDQTQFGNEVADDADVTVHNHRAQGTHDNEWYTPGDYVEAAREVMGSIDLDPASSEIANQTVQAAQFFTIEDDGLQQTWTGNVWMNPPYAQPGIAQFMSKLTAEIAKGTATQAIALTHSYTDTAWFQSAAAVSDAVCFTRGRIAFLDPNGKKAAPTQGQAFFYFGPNAAKFAEVFGPIGWVVMGNAPAMVEAEAAA